MKNFVSLAFLVCLTASLCVDSYALDPNRAVTQYLLRVWREEDGLTTKDVTSIIQTRDGYLWMGSVDGLLRFDGVRFKVFSADNTPGINQSYVTALAEDRDGSLWIGTYGGGLAHYQNGKFTAIGAKEGLSSPLTRSLCVTRDGTLWIGTEGGLISLKDGKFTTFQPKAGPGSEIVEGLKEDSKGVMWVGTGKGLFKFQGGRFTPVEMVTPDGAPAIYPVYSIVESRDGTMWFGMFGGGVNHFVNGKMIAYSTGQGLTSPMVTRMFEDRDGNLWIGTQGGGLNRYYNGKFSAITQSQGLSSNLVFSIFEDREGTLWVGTNFGTDGLNQLRNGKFLSYTSREGLISNNTWSIIQDRNDRSIWIASQGGINHLKDGKITTYADKELPVDQLVKVLFQTRDGTIWGGTGGGGLIKLKDGKFTLYTKEDGLASNGIFTIDEGDDGTLWVGTDSGLDSFKDGRFHSYSTKDGLASDLTKVIYIDRQDTLWIGSNGGLTRFKDGTFTTYASNSGISKELVRSIYEDRDGVLWVGTLGGGLNRFKDGRFVPITSSYGLLDNTIWGIVVDNHDNLWMSSSRGVFRVSRKELNDFADGRSHEVHSFGYGTADGLRGACAGGSYPSAARTADGKLWFPTFAGAVEIDPDRIPTNHLAPNVVIEQVIADSVPIELNGNPRVPPGRGALEFHYTALSLAVPGGVNFKYKLEGYDNDWVDAGTRRVAFYTNLPSGQYRFRVIACNGDGVWNEQGAVAGFYLRAHFYNSWWFYSLAAAVLAGSALVFFRLRVRQIRERANRLEVVVQRRTEELKQFTEQLERSNRELESFAYIASHDLQEPLRKVQAFGDRLKSKYAESLGSEGADYVNRMQRATARMQTLISDLLVFSRVTTKASPMQEVDLGAVAREVISDLEVRVEKTGAKIEMGALPTIEADPLQMRQLFQNLLGNALKFVRPDTRPLVRITGASVAVSPGILRVAAAPGNGDRQTVTGSPPGQEKVAELVVEDNGIGFEQKYAERIFAPFQRLIGKENYEGTGIGLAICQKIVQRHGGTIRAESGLGIGSRFIVRLPVKQTSERHRNELDS